MTIIIRVVTGAIQDADDNAYTRVTIVYVFLAISSLVVSLILLFAASCLSGNLLRRLQWTRKERLKNGHLITIPPTNRLISYSCLSALACLVLGAWVAYFWGVATGNNS